jgi:Zn-dependent protease
MLQTLYLGKLKGIAIYIHWSFWLIAIVFFANALPAGIKTALASVGFLFAIFFCVFLHELGHALAAKMFKVNTLDITLLPFGGVARLESMPRNSLAELTIALAGPAVNFVIALSLLIGLSIGFVYDRMSMSEIATMGPLEQLLVANVFIAIFNLIPAFPMDGGRVLRALLGFVTSFSRATYIAGRIGQIIAVIMLVFSIMYFQFSLFMISIFVFIMSTTEMINEKMRSTIEKMQKESRSGYTFDTQGRTGFDGQRGEIVDAVDVRRID